MRDKGARFRQLHSRCFVIANAWDAGSARILAGLGFQALATSSGAHAGTLGKRDGHVTRDEALAHAKAIVEATELPVSADLEKCFADEPKAAAETIRLAAGVGLAGCSIEDATEDKGLTTSAMRSNAWLPPSRWRARTASRSCSPPGRRTSCAAARTWTTPSSACRPTRRPAPTC